MIKKIFLIVVVITLHFTISLTADEIIWETKKIDLKNTDTIIPMPHPEDLVPGTYKWTFISDGQASSAVDYTDYYDVGHERKYISLPTYKRGWEGEVWMEGTVEGRVDQVYINMRKEGDDPKATWGQIRVTRIGPSKTERETSAKKDGIIWKSEKINLKDTDTTITLTNPEDLVPGTYKWTFISDGQASAAVDYTDYYDVGQGRKYISIPTYKRGWGGEVWMAETVEGRVDQVYILMRKEGDNPAATWGQIILQRLDISELEQEIAGIEQEIERDELEIASREQSKGVDNADRISQLETRIDDRIVEEVRIAEEKRLAEEKKRQEEQAKLAKQQQDKQTSAFGVDIPPGFCPTGESLYIQVINATKTNNTELLRIPMVGLRDHLRFCTSCNVPFSFKQTLDDTIRLNQW